MDIKIFDKISTKLVESETISAEDKQLYEYGLKQAANTFVNLVTTLIIGFIFGMVWESILFMVAYIPLRSYAGGYHARTPAKCYICSVILTASVLMVAKYIPHDSILIGALALVSSYIIFVFAPIGDENKPLDKIEIDVYKKRTRIILLVEVVIAGLMLSLSLRWVTICIISSMVVASFMLVVGVASGRLGD